MTDKMANKIRVVVLYGGRSGEHEVSLKSAASAFRHLDRTRFEVMPDCGHWPQYEDPKTFNQLHIDFLLGRS